MFALSLRKEACDGTDWTIGVVTAASASQYCLVHHAERDVVASCCTAMSLYRVMYIVYNRVYMKAPKRIT